MFTTRRRFATLVSGSLATAALVRAAPAWARADDTDDPPNVFFSPHGRPYRAPAGTPYPVVNWFRDADRNGDGKLDLGEFVADASAFFDALDQKGQGALDADDISFYEHRIAPEVLGVRVTVYADGQMRVSPAKPRLWLAQYGPMEGGPFGPTGQGQGPTGQGGPGQTARGGDPNEGEIVPKDAQRGPDTKSGPDPDLSAGAASFGLIRAPEPVTAADPDYVTRGVVRKTSFLAHARSNFAALDPQHTGYLTLASLPQSPVQQLLERRHGKR
jgi:hypothetical protein